MLRLGMICLLAISVAACSGEGTRLPEVEPTGPPTVQPGDVDEHALQFDDEVPERPAGSQNEGAASAYLLGHLQQAGYVVHLDGVPVGNLVRSTNVVAVPPTGEPPTSVVVVAYDTGADAQPTGASLGLFLELARALRVATPSHSVEFAALGAENTDVSGGHLGSRRLIRGFADDDLEPLVVVLGPIADGTEFSARGPVAEALGEVADGAGDAAARRSVAAQPEDEVWVRSGLEFAVVSGSPAEIGTVLLEFLAERGR